MHIGTLKFPAWNISMAPHNQSPLQWCSIHRSCPYLPVYTWTIPSLQFSKYTMLMLVILSTLIPFTWIIQSILYCDFTQISIPPGKVFPDLLTRFSSSFNLCISLSILTVFTLFYKYLLRHLPPASECEFFEDGEYSNSPFYSHYLPPRICLTHKTNSKIFLNKDLSCVSIKS